MNNQEKQRELDGLLVDQLSDEWESEYISGEMCPFCLDELLISVDDNRLECSCNTDWSDLEEIMSKESEGKKRYIDKRFKEIKADAKCPE